MSEEFIKDVHEGLSTKPKTLPSKYFYDKNGDELFVKIMNLPEYYLTRSELEIFHDKTNDIINSLALNPDDYFELIELGAGNGKKTKELLKRLIEQNHNFTYIPIDISANALHGLKNKFRQELPNVMVEPKEGDYFNVLSTLKNSNHPKVVLFLGSNLGNMNDDVASDFMTKLSDSLHSGDKLILGLDLIKNKDIVLPAYDDSDGITAQFNMNLLKRINKELGGTFDLNNFEHSPVYDENEGIAKSYIKSKIKQSVKITATNSEYEFDKDELIHTEISRKYNDGILNEIIKDSAFILMDKIMDSRAYFADYVLNKQ